MKLTVVTLFEASISNYFEEGILGRAKREGLYELAFINPRDFALDKYKSVDDYKMGHGAGMIMSMQPLFDLLFSIKKEDPKAHFIFPTPVAPLFSTNDAKRLATKTHLVMVCGRYEGIDERLIEHFANEVFSLGNFILSGAELAAAAFLDATLRFVPKVLGNELSLVEESFENSLLEAPAFAKPLHFEKEGCKLSANSAYLQGSHGKIADLNFKMSLCKSRFHRLDLAKSD